MNDEERQNEVYRLIQQGSSLKMIMHQTEEAILYFKKAEQLAKQTPPLPKIWRAIIYYRLGHLTMRVAKNNVKKLKDAEQYFTITSQISPESHLDTLSKIYRLAALRCLEFVSNEDHEDIHNKIVRAFDKTVLAFKKNVNAQDVVNLSKDWKERNKQIINLQLQEGLFNMLELSSYFLGVPYSAIEGLGTPFNDRFFPVDNDKTAIWQIIGAGSSIQIINYTKEMALQELEDRFEENPDIVIFKLTYDTGDIKKERHMKIGDNEWQKIPFLELKLLALLVSKHVGTKEELIRKITNSEADCSDHYRQIKKRLIGTFQTIIGHTDIQLFESDKRNEIPKINRNIKIIGAIQKEVLSRN